MTMIGSRDPKLGNLIKYEEGSRVGYCRKVVTVNEAAETEYTIGMLVGTDGTDWKLSDPTASDGSEDIAGIVLENKTVEASTDTEVVVMFRGPAGVADAALVLGDHDAEDAAEALEALGIKVFEQV